MSESVEILAAGMGWLTPADAVNVYTQFGEDGLVAKALDRIGEKNRCCFEVGAADGDFYSNTRRLREAGWRAVLIESEAEAFAKLAEKSSGAVICIHRKIGRDCLDKLLFANDMPADLDFGVIDIDGQDYWAWEGMEAFRPRLMLLEFNETDDPAPPLGHGPDRQAGRTAIEKLGRDKGYLPLAATRVNLLFAREDCLKTA